VSKDQDGGLYVWLRYPPDHLNILEVAREFVLVEVRAGATTWRGGRVDREGVGRFDVHDGDRVEVLSLMEPIELLTITAWGDPRRARVVEVRPPLMWRSRVVRPLRVWRWGVAPDSNTDSIVLEAVSGSQRAAA
jgi:hypothetical protein